MYALLTILLVYSIAIKPYVNVMYYGTQPLVKIEGQFTSYQAGMFKIVDAFHGFVLMILFAYILFTHIQGPRNRRPGGPDPPRIGDS